MRTRYGTEIQRAAAPAPRGFEAPLTRPFLELPELVDLPDPPYELGLQWLPESPDEIDLYCYETLDDEIFEPIPEPSPIFKTPAAAMRVSGSMFDPVYALHPVACQR